MSDHYVLVSEGTNTITTMVMGQSEPTIGELRSAIFAGWTIPRGTLLVENAQGGYDVKLITDQSLDELQACVKESKRHGKIIGQAFREMRR